jgi:hypothetical protein
MRMYGSISALLALVAMVSAAYAQNPEMSGKWALNPDKSQGPAPASETLIYQISGDEEHYSADATQKDGSKFRTEYRAKYDGKEYPNKNLVTGRITYTAIKQMFPRVEEVTNIRHVRDSSGKEVSEVTNHFIRILSADGKEITSVLTDAKGAVTSVRVFDKQSD